MRYIFMDEAGTSADEPVRVVVGLIADADAHIKKAEWLMLEMLGAVPPQHRDGFVFHATELLQKRRFQVGWSMTERIALLRSIMSIPRNIGMGITISVHWRNAVDYKIQGHLADMSMSQTEHLMAFISCVGLADRNIRKYAGPNEVAAIVAEDEPQMRKYLRRVPQLLRESPMHYRPEQLRWMPRDHAAGFMTQEGDLRVSRIRNSIHFVEKSEDPIVQMADACAYGIRRFFAGEKFGGEFADAIIGDRKRIAHFEPPAVTTCFWGGS